MEQQHLTSKTRLESYSEGIYPFLRVICMREISDGLEAAKSHGKVNIRQQTPIFYSAITCAI